jgi:threonine dehydrogenase-like Zn-dependent dehydrogenase
MALIHQDKAKPSEIISHELPLTEAPKAYKNFDERVEGWHKVILHPQAA